MVDDIVDTAGTLTAGIKMLYDKGATNGICTNKAAQIACLQAFNRRSGKNSVNTGSINAQ